ncbi:MAG: lipase family protein [Acidimicrobiales bacterium]
MRARSHRPADAHRRIGASAWVRALGLLLGAALLVGACSSDTGDGAGAGTRAAEGTTTAASPAEDGDGGSTATVERYDGDLDGFYEVPDPLPAGEPGDLIRTMAVSSDADHVTVRVMYRSVDATGADRAVTGLITYPVAAAPDGGWPVISTAHGTSGIATQCAPSRTSTAAPGWGVDGVWAMTDYIGLGPLGELHAYLSKVDEGNAVIDIVRAARQIPDAHASDRWVSIGHSQGGHGALAAHELAAEHAPELHLVATVALSPGALLDRVYGGIDPIVTTILTMMASYGGQAEEPKLSIAEHFTPAALEASKVFETGCLDEITNALIPVAAAGAFTADPRTTEPARSVILANDVGGVAVDGVPLLLASGTNDDRVVIDRFRDLVSKVCATGQVAEVHIIDGADHGTILAAMADDVERFVDDALAGGEPRDTCGDDPASWERPMA